MAPRKIIIDTDPGVDDILAMLLAFSALPEELEVLLISVTYGNIDVQNCLRNVISMFHHIEQEMAWRQSQGKPPGFDALRRTRPLVAVGPDRPLADQMLMADFFHGIDGLGGIHHTHPHLTPADTWKHLFTAAEKSSSPDQAVIADELKKTDSIFTASQTPAHQEILRVLRENDPDTISIVAIGPLTNLAIAAAEDPETFLRVKEVVVMGGAVEEVGNVRPFAQPKTPHFATPAFNLIKQPPTPPRTALNIRNQMTPVAEFNTYADTIAAARLYALTSPKPETTMPPIPPTPAGQQKSSPPPPHLSPYPTALSRKLKITLFPLDITETHPITSGQFRTLISPLPSSPLKEWTTAIMSATFAKIESLHPAITGDAISLSLHDPLCIWYCMTVSHPGWKMIENEDLRVETAGQWTRGMCVVDRRARVRLEDGDESEVAGDTDGWLGGGKGNRLRRCIGSPDAKGFGTVMLKTVFGLQ